jgi:hypothetical protein
MPSHGIPGTAPTQGARQPRQNAAAAQGAAAVVLQLGF